MTTTASLPFRSFPQALSVTLIALFALALMLIGPRVHAQAGAQDAVHNGPQIDAQPLEQAKAAVDRGLAFLRETQNEDGSWSPEPGPAITALCCAVFSITPM